MRTSLTALALLALTAGCEGWPPDPPPPPVVMLGLSLDANDVSIQQGSARTLNATVRRVGEIGVNLELRAEDVSPGLVVEIAAPSTVNDVSTAAVSVRASSEAAIGLHSVTIRALGEPLKRAKVSPSIAVLLVRVTEPSTFAMTLSRSTAGMMRGGMSRVTARIARANMTDPVTLSLAGAPGITAQYSENPTTADSVVVTLSAAAGAQPGTVAATIRADAGGLPGVERPIGITVTDDRIQLLGPETLVAGQGSGVSFPVQLLRADYDGPVTLSATQLPPGVTASFEPATVTGEVFSLVLMIDGAALPGAYPVVMSASGTDMEAVTGEVTLQVLPSSVVVVADPSTVSLLQGTGGGLGITLERTMFDGPLAIAIDGAPPGLDITVEPSVVSGSTATVSVSVAADLAAGDYNVVLRATPLGPAPGSSVSANVSVSVRAPVTGGSVVLDWSACAYPDWVAFQDGDGPWIQVLPSGGVARFSVDSDRGAFAYVEGGNVLRVEYRAMAELTTAAFEMCPPVPEPTRTIHGGAVHQFQGLSHRHFVGGKMGVSSTAQPSFSISDVPVGPQDMLSIGTTSTGTRIRIRRDLDPPEGSVLDLVDIADLEASPALGATFTISGTGAPSGNGTLRTTSEYLMGSACYRTPEPLFTGQLGVAATGPFVRFVSVAGVPAVQQRPGDFHLVTANFVASGSDLTASVVIPAIQSRSITLVASTVPTVSNVGTTQKRLRAQLGNVPPAYNLWRSLRYTDQQRTTHVRASAEYTGGENVVLTVPDLRGVNGWQSSYGIPAHEQGTWLVQLEGANGAGLCAAGRTLNTARHIGTF